MRTWPVAFEAEGLNIERMIHQAGNAGIILTGLKRTGRRSIGGYVPEGDLPQMLEIADKGGWLLRIGERQGTGKAIEMLCYRWLLAVCGVFLLVTLAGAMQMVWRVEVCDAGAYEADIRAYLREEGILPFRLKKDIDAGVLRDQLEWRYPDIAWIECGWRGETLRITVMQGEAAGETLTHAGAGDVVASRDGVVDSVITLAGTPQVKAGETVHRGDILIRGEERTSEGNIRAVSARGRVYAKVWEHAQVRMSLWETQTIPTGSIQECWTASSPWFDLWKADNSNFERQDVSVDCMALGGVFIPVLIRREIRMEVNTQRLKRDISALKSETEDAAMRILQKKLGMGDEFLTKWVDYSIVDDEILCADAYGERVMDIGVRLRQEP